jgi:nucleoside-diphosphate-sugar epimerase
MSQSLNALVTGGTGFIGNYLVENLIKKHQVRCLVRETSNINKIKFLEGLGVDIAYGDLRDKKSLKPAFKGIDCIFHLAAEFGKNLPENAYCEVNVKGTENLLSLCKENNVKRIIHCSAVGVYGPIKKGKIADENSPYNPSNAYEKSKCEGEKIAINFMNSGLPLTIIQPAVVYGPRDTSNIYKLFKAIKNHKFFIIGDGKNKKHFVYVENLINGIILASEKKETIGQKYIIGDEKALTILEATQTIAEALNVSIPKLKIPRFTAKLAGNFFEETSKILNFDPPLTKDRVLFLTENHVYDITKAKRDLGYNPSISFKEGVNLTIDWCKANNFL